MTYDSLRGLEEAIPSANPMVGLAARSIYLVRWLSLLPLSRLLFLGSLVYVGCESEALAIVQG
jgi:hypothetical protein